jgi:hypothetical protein
VFDFDAEFLGQVTEDREDDARRDDRRDEVQRGHDRCVNVNLKSEQCIVQLAQPLISRILVSLHSHSSFSLDFEGISMITGQKYKNSSKRNPNLNEAF